MFCEVDIGVGKIKVFIDEAFLTVLLKGKMSYDGKVLGLHHDLDGFMKKAPQNDITVMEVTKDCGHGYYKAAVWDGYRLTREKTFFPDTIGPEEIMSLIRQGLTSDARIITYEGDKVVIEAPLIDDIHIRIVLAYSGSIACAYPVKFSPV